MSLEWKQIFPSSYPRDLTGYAGNTPSRDKCWPNNERIAVQFVINYEEGGENTILNNDSHSETLLSEIVGAQAYKGQQHMNMESLYEYGSRAGFWRILRLFKNKNIPATIYAVGLALELNPEAGKAMKNAKNMEVASHGYRWIDYQNIDIETERDHIKKAVEVSKNIINSRPLGIYQGKPNCNTRSLIVEEGGFKYDSDSYSDDLPYWTYWKDSKKNIRSHLIIPYTLDCNDMRFAQGLETNAFFNYLKDAFLTLYDEGLESPKMMTIGLHCRVVGRPARIAALGRFIDFIKDFKDVWICKRIDICEHWYNNHPPNPPKI